VPICSDAKLRKVHPHGIPWISPLQVRVQLCGDLDVPLRNKVISVATYSNCVQAATLAPTAKLLESPGISPGSADQCILGDVYLRSNLSRKLLESIFMIQACYQAVQISASLGTCI